MAADKIDFQLLFEHLPSLYLIIKPDCTIVEVSKPYLAATMTTREGILGRNLFDVFPDNPNDPNALGSMKLRESLKNVLKYKKKDIMGVTKYDIRRTEKEGGGFEERFWSPENSPVFDANGNIIYIVHRVEDVTEFIHLKQRGEEQQLFNKALYEKNEKMAAEIYLKSLEQIQSNQKIDVFQKELLQANQSLETLNKQLLEADIRKSEFVATVSHELRTPMNAILGFSELLKTQLAGPLTPKQDEYIGNIYKSGHHLLMLINDILDLSKIEAGKLQLTPEPIDVKRILNEALSIFNEKLINKKIDLKLHVDSAIGVATFDPIRLKQIIFNLLSNAVKFTSEGKSVSVDAVLVGNKIVKITVTDSGAGIPRQELENLFKPYSQFDNTKMINPEGTGLGLMIVKRLVELQAGTIEVNSVLNVGTSFIIQLPYHPDKNTRGKYE